MVRVQPPQHTKLANGNVREFFYCSVGSKELADCAELIADMTNVEQRISGFIQALRAGNVEEAVAYFSPTGTYQEAGANPIVGHDAIRACLQRFVSLDRPWNFIVDELVCAADARSAAVVHRFLIEGGEGEQLEVAGCTHVKLSGDRFDLWREYSG